MSDDARRESGTTTERTEEGAVKVQGLTVPAWVSSGIKWKPDYVQQFLCSSSNLRRGGGARSRIRADLSRRKSFLRYHRIW